MATLPIALTALALVASCAAHSNLIYPKPRNAIDSLLPEWSNGTSPYAWQPYGDAPCACTNGTEACASAQTCLWFSVGCSIGCAECDGGDAGGANPNLQDRCGSGTKATINDPLHRTINRDAVAGSDADWTKHNPWRAPGSAPVYDPCGRASGGPHATGGHGEFTNTTFASLGDLGSALPKMPSGAVWAAGSTVETMWSLRANHGGGYQYRLCPLGAELTEACFQQTPVPFAGDSSLMLGNGTKIKLNSTFVSEGTLPAGSTWQMNPIPGYVVEKDGGWDGNKLKRWFDPPCDDPASLHPERLGQGLCSGEWLTKVTTYDKLRVPEHLVPGEYVLSFRWDCESSAQIWQSCSDITITGEKGSAEGSYTFENKADLQAGVNLWMTDEQAAEKMYGNITDWDVSEVPDLSKLFYRKTAFNADISKWITSQATDMTGMFNFASSFNTDISTWITSKVESMYYMFWGATNFNSDISAWITSRVTNMHKTFWQAPSFNADISAWITSGVTSMGYMFAGATSFNADISKWISSRWTSQVTNTVAMFGGATSFNADISTWITRQVTSMISMFGGATSFNADISKWTTSKATTMYSMFESAASFNVDISAWITSHVTDMSRMFYGATSFSQSDVCKWEHRQLQHFTNMFDGSGMPSGCGWSYA